MAITLNLIPQDQVITGKLAKFLKAVKAMGIISLVIFVFSVLGITGLIVLNSSKINNLNSQVEALKDQVLDLQVSEQQIAFLKDRVQKIQIVREIPDSLENLSSVESLIGEISETTKVTELDVDSKKAGFSLNFKSNADMLSFFEKLKESTIFKSVILSSFGLSPTTGYLASFSVLDIK